METRETKRGDKTTEEELIYPVVLLVAHLSCRAVSRPISDFFPQHFSSGYSDIQICSDAFFSLFSSSLIPVGLEYRKRLMLCFRDVWKSKIPTIGFQFRK